MSVLFSIVSASHIGSEIIMNVVRQLSSVATLMHIMIKFSTQQIERGIYIQ